MPSGVYERTPETRKHISEAALKFWRELDPIEELRMGIARSQRQRDWWANHPEARELASQKATTQHATMTKEDKIARERSIAASLRGKGHSEETKELLRQTQLDWWTPARRDERAIRYMGEGHPMYRGEYGSLSPYGDHWDDFRFFILSRDGFRCRLCGSKVELRVHHIDYDTDNRDDSNLVTLCEVCNPRVNFSRDYWRKYFSEMLGDIKESESLSRQNISEPGKLLKEVVRSQ